MADGALQTLKLPQPSVQAKKRIFLVGGAVVRSRSSLRREFAQLLLIMFDLFFEFGNQGECPPTSLALSSTPALVAHRLVCSQESKSVG
jgi:hypothetical protein